MRSPDLDHVLILNGIELSHAWSRSGRAARRSSMGGPEVMVAALGHDIVAIDEHDGVIPQVLESLPRHDHAPSACPWLDRIIGVLRRCGPPYVVATTLVWWSLPDGISRLSPTCALLVPAL